MSCVIKWYLYFFNLGGNIGLVMVIFSIQLFPLLSYLMHVNSLNRKICSMAVITKMLHWSFFEFS